MNTRKLLIGTLVVAIVVVAAMLFKQKGGCIRTTNCAVGKVCTKFKCVALPPGPSPPPGPCTTDVMCGPGNICVGGKCIRMPGECVTNEQCGPGKACIGTMCVAVSPAPPPPVVKPRAAQIRDCGWQDRLRGWFDAQGQGVRNDYCRYVGNAEDKNFSCVLAGSGQEYSPPYDPVKLAPSCDGSAGSGCGGGGCGPPV